MSPFALDIIVRASALLAAAALVDLVLRRRASAATRHLVWTLAIGALLALPIASYVLPEWTVPHSDRAAVRAVRRRRDRRHARRPAVVTPDARLVDGARSRPCVEDGRRCNRIRQRGRPRWRACRA